MLGTSNDRLKLSQWALAYRQTRGQEQYCPKRAENWDIRLSQAKPGELKYHRAKADLSRQSVEDVKAARDLHGADAEKIIAAQRAETAKVAKESASTRDRHSADWKTLAQSDKARKAHIGTSAENAIQDALFSIKATYRPQWQELGRRHSKERKDYQERETRVLGKIRNAIEAVSQARLLDPDSSRGFVSNTFNYLISAPKRAKAFERKLELEARALGNVQKTEIRKVTGNIRASRDALLKSARSTAATERAALSQGQAIEIGSLKAKWRQLSEGRARAFDAARRASQVKAHASAETRETFTAAAEDRKPRSTGRRRSRKRDRD